MCDLRTDFSFLPRPNLRILSSSRYRDPLFFEASCSSRPPDARDSRESAHKQNTINADNLGSPRSASFPPAPLQRAAVLDNQFFFFERELRGRVGRAGQENMCTHQTCGPAGGASVCARAASGLSSYRSGTCAGPPRLERCHPRIQLEGERKQGNLEISEFVT